MTMLLGNDKYSLETIQDLLSMIVNYKQNKKCSEDSSKEI